MELKNHLIYDPIYGFIDLTPLEWEIIHTPFYQRLRWIKQLGFSCYTFHGAEHSRFGHSIGVMFNAHKILESCSLAVPIKDLVNPNVKSEEKKFHQSIRLSALMHDLGTFPFSHTTEGSYIQFGETTQKDNSKKRVDDHEHLGSFIIKNTDYPDGITSILKRYDFDPQEISDLVKGVGKSVLANQILHSDIDCDRMDYLLRDAHYTGLNYGSYDRDYLLHHFRTVEVNGHRILTIKHNAIHCVEDFLMARFAWYSQVIRSARGAKYDALAQEVCYYMLEKKIIHRYSNLLEMIERGSEYFYHFNDVYFMNLVYQSYVSGQFDKVRKIKDMAKSILFEKTPKTIRSDEFNQRLMDQNDQGQTDKYFKRAFDKVDSLKKIIEKKGTEADWIVTDIPQKSIIFVKSHQQLVKNKQNQNLLLERDPVKILMDDGEVKLLPDVENSIISKLQNTYNFVPNVFCSESAYQLFKQENLI